MVKNWEPLEMALWRLIVKGHTAPITLMIWPVSVVVTHRL